MGTTSSIAAAVTIDLSDHWDVTPHLDEALAAFDRLVELIDGAAGVDPDTEIIIPEVIIPEAA